MLKNNKYIRELITRYHNFIYIIHGLSALYVVFLRINVGRMIFNCIYISFSWHDNIIVLFTPSSLLLFLTQSDYPLMRIMQWNLFMKCLTHLEWNTSPEFNIPFPVCFNIYIIYSLEKTDVQTALHKHFFLLSSHKNNTALLRTGAKQDVNELYVTHLPRVDNIIGIRETMDKGIYHIIVGHREEPTFMWLRVPSF